MKILHYIPGFRSGGIESRLIDWYKHIDRDQIEFHVIKLNDVNDSPNAIDFINLGGKFYNLPSLNPKNLLKYLIELNKVIDKSNYDIIHVHDLNSGLFPLIIAYFKGIKIRIFHSRSNAYLPNEKYLRVKKIQKKIIPFFSNVYYACSKNAGNFAFGNRKFNIIKNGIDINCFKKEKNILNLKSNKEQIIIGSVSRISPQKNLFFLLEVFELFVQRYNNSKLVIVGDGDELLKKELKKRAIELSIDSKVEFVGTKSNVVQYYKSFDLFIATSFYEGFGTTAIEAQGAGIKALVSTGFPKSVEITRNLKRLDLSLKKERWVKEMENILFKDLDFNYLDEIKNAGYDIRIIANDLEKRYYELVEKYENS